MRDVMADGKQAYLDGKSRSACLYCRGTHDSDNYWDSCAGHRQIWLGGYNMASSCNEIIARRHYIPAAEWREWS